MKKRILSLILAAAMVCSLFAGLTLTASAQQTYTVSIRDAGDLYTDTCAEGTYYVLPEFANEVDGYFWEGWLDEPIDPETEDFPNDILFGGEDIEVLENTTVYAVYSRTAGSKTYYTTNPVGRTAFFIDYSVLGEIVLTDIKDVGYTCFLFDAASVAEYEVSGYMLEGWTAAPINAETEDFPNDILFGGEEYEDDADVTLYAVYSRTAGSKTYYTTNPTAEAGCAHTSTSVVGAVPASCTAPGYTGDTVCNDCSETVSAGSVIPALGHSCGAWSSNDNGTHSAICSHCSQTVTKDCVLKFNPSMSSANVSVYVCADCGYSVSRTQYTVITKDVYDVFMEKYSEGTLYILPDYANEIDGYTWEGWVTAPIDPEIEDFPSDILFANEDYEITEDTTFYAVYSRIDGSNIYCTTNPVGRTTFFIDYNVLGTIVMADYCDDGYPLMLLDISSVSDYAVDGCYWEGWVEAPIETPTTEFPNDILFGGEDYETSVDVTLYAVYSFDDGGKTYYTTDPAAREICTHETTAIVGAVAATCTVPGYTGDTVCSDCGETVSTGSAIAALGHDCGAWTANGNGTHSAVCGRCTQTITKDCTFKSSVSGTVVTYTCTVCSYQYTTERYTISIRDAGDLYTDTCNAGELYTVPDFANEVDSYVWEGWVTAPIAPETEEFPNDLIFGGEDFEPTGNTVIYAVYSRTEADTSYYTTNPVGRMTYFIDYSVLGEIILTDISDVGCPGLLLDLSGISEYAVDGYTWEGWLEAPIDVPTEAFPNDILFAGEEYEAAADTVLYAVYSTEEAGTTYYTTDPGAPLPGLKISSAYLRIAENINVIYAAEVPADCTDPYMVFTFLGRDIKVTNYTEADGKLLFELSDVVPQCMGDNISATLYAKKDGKTETDTVAEYSIKTYCAKQLAKTDDAELIALLSDLLTYGAAAQTYTSYKTGALVTSGLDLAPSAFTALEAKKATFASEKSEAADWNSATLVLSNDLGLRFTFKAASVDGLSVDVTINGRTQAFTDFTDLGNGKYAIIFCGIKATEFDDTVTASFKLNGETVGRTVSYSVNTYISTAQACGNTNLEVLVKALYNYGASVAAYAK